MKQILLCCFLLGSNINAFGYFYQVDTNVCDSKTIIANEMQILKPLRKAILRANWDKDSPKKSDIKLSKNIDREVYDEIDIDQLAFLHCRYKDASYIQVINEDGVIKPMVAGWVDTAIFTTRLDPNNKYEGLIQEDIYKDEDHSYWGNKDLQKLKPELDILRVKAAEKIIDLNRCYIVSRSDISLFSEANNIVVSIHCVIPQTLFSLSKDEILNKAGIKLRLKKALSKQETFDRCKTMIEDQVSNSKLLSFYNMLNNGFHLAPTGDTRMIVDYDMGNVKYRGICFFSIDGDTDLIVIQPK